MEKRRIEEKRTVMRKIRRMLKMKIFVKLNMSQIFFTSIKDKEK